MAMMTLGKIAVVFCVLARAQDISAQPLSAQEIHDRLVTVMSRNAVVRSGTDTAVTWGSSGPILYHVVTRWRDSIAVGMFRNDPLAGQASVRFVNGAVKEAVIRWSRGDNVVREVRIDVSDSLRVRDSAVTAYAIPSQPWAVADYGMDDLLVAALSALEPTRWHAVRVFRPYGAKWDDLTVRKTEMPGGKVFETVAAPDDTTWHVVSSEGALVQVLRSRFPDNERRPLERTPPVATYLRLRRAPPP